MTENISTRQRLIQGCECLEQIDSQRDTAKYNLLGMLVEHRIVWRELLDLELQDIDEQIARIALGAA